ncbi:bacterio-opsin activator-like protein [Haloferax elongans ATCC BAA-1513]|uniref:Bacterio-opsin activator-like protein n=1 Tax=Haloferax elongans ATCC BAA-1513 TaxID=1230453 RepID=M0HJA4_HALEO|nr:helix-turn-helix domain-containing protein [Haloferax elongans]ELZ84620.1 bacterio-opsin activator-like protein [Haloferax elongans ATCC BAA-1513]
MSKVGTPSGGFAGTTRLTLKIRHPDCWTLEVTEQTNAGIVAHTVYNTPGNTVKGHFTVYADRIEDIDEFIQAARSSRLTDSVSELSPRHEFDKDTSNIGNTTRELVVEYDPANSMTDLLLAHGFVHDAPVRVDNGWEYWPVIDTEGREQLKERIDALETEADAEIIVTKVTSVVDAKNHVKHRQDRLSNRQREVFELACKHNYYGWPRETTTRELAEELGISKTTVLEHLRKAEAKLLDQYQ